MKICLVRGFVVMLLCLGLTGGVYADAYLIDGSGNLQYLNPTGYTTVSSSALWAGSMLVGAGDGTAYLKGGTGDVVGLTYHVDSAGMGYLANLGSAGLMAGAGDGTAYLKTSGGTMYNLSSTAAAQISSSNVWGDDTAKLVASGGNAYAIAGAGGVIPNGRIYHLTPTAGTYLNRGMGSNYQLAATSGDTAFAIDQWNGVYHVTTTATNNLMTKSIGGMLVGAGEDTGYYKDPYGYVYYLTASSAPYVTYKGATGVIVGAGDDSAYLKSTSGDMYYIKGTGVAQVGSAGVWGDDNVNLVGAGDGAAYVIAASGATANRLYYVTSTGATLLSMNMGTGALLVAGGAGDAYVQDQWGQVWHATSTGVTALGTFDTGGTLVGAGVPEPATLTFLSMGSLLVLLRRKKYYC